MARIEYYEVILSMAKVQSSSVGGMLTSMGQRIRPWTTDFASVSQFTKPGDDWAKRLQVNATYYKGNYSIIFFAFVLYSIISNPFLLMSILILTGALIVSRKSQETLSILLPLTRGSSQLPVLNHPPFPCLRKALDT